MASQSAMLATLKLAQLRILAIKTGLSISGSKPVLTKRLADEMQLCALTQSTSSTTSTPLRILSIDMGIRNLAYCLIETPPPSTSPNTILPQIQAWQRLGVSDRPKPLVRYKVPIQNLASNLKHPPKEKRPIEPFDPATLSKVAYDLLTRQLLLTKPTHILIERQRFRSSSASAVLEWTLRVNMFESIIYAILTTLKEEGKWSGTVMPIQPGKIGPYWLGPEKKPDEQIATGDYKRLSKAKNIKAVNKGRKVDLVRTWLANGDMVGLGNDWVVQMAEKYIEKWDKRPGGQTGPRKTVKEREEEEELEKKGIPKLDDLADCLLQGIAWLEWERNKKVLIGENGVSRLLETDTERFQKLITANAVGKLD